MMLGIRVIRFSVLLTVAGSLSAAGQALQSPQQHTVLGDRNIRHAPATAKNAYSKEQSRRRSEEAKKYYNLAVRFGRANLFRQAAELCLKAIDLRPDYRDAYFELGRAYEGLGQWEDSIAAYEKLLASNPKDKKALTALATARQKLAGQRQPSLGPKESSAVGEKINLSLSASAAGSRKATAPSPEPPSLLEIYRVGAGDVLEIRFDDIPADRATLFAVTSTGLLDYPLLEQPLRVIGLTLEEIALQLKERATRASASRDADVFVAVREYNSHIVLVSGLVKEPGPKILRREAIPLYVVLADAQTLPEAEQVTIVFRRESEPLTSGIREARTSSILIQSGDVITVQTAPQQYFYVGGEVRNPGEKPFRTGMTLTQAILSAGGATERGKKIELRRQHSSGLLANTIYKMKEIDSGKLPDVTIQPGDRILVIN